MDAGHSAITMGGIGVRSAQQLAPSAFLASAVGAVDLLSLLLPSRILVIPDPAVSMAEAAWKTLGGVVCPVGRDAGVQRGWDLVTCAAAETSLQQGADECTNAQLPASRAPGSDSWLSQEPAQSRPHRWG